MLRGSRGDAAVLPTTFLLTVCHDLTAGILAGFGLGTLLFLQRVAHSVEIKKAWPPLAEDKPVTNMMAPYDARVVSDPDILFYRLLARSFLAQRQALLRCWMNSPSARKL